MAPRKPRYQPSQANTVAELNRVYRQNRILWRNSEQREEVRDLFERSILPLKCIKDIDQAICIGLGSFCQENEFIAGDYGIEGLMYPKGLVSMTQFIAFEYWIELLRTQTDITSILFSDPAFTNVDISFLAARGYYDIIDDAESRVTEETFLFAPIGNHLDVLADCIKTAHPHLMISNSIESSGHVIDIKSLRRGESYCKLKSHGRYQRVELARRKITRPFQNTHIARPLLRLTDAMPWGYTVPKENYERFRAGSNIHRTYANDRRGNEGARMAPGLADLQRQNIHPALLWTSHVWIYWKPDNRSRLYGMQLGPKDDLKYCTCFDCTKVIPAVDMGLSRERPPSPITPDTPNFNEEVFNEVYTHSCFGIPEDEVEMIPDSPVKSPKQTIRMLRRGEKRVSFVDEDDSSEEELESVPNTPSWRRFIPSNPPSPSDSSPAIYITTTSSTPRTPPPWGAFVSPTSTPTSTPTHSPWSRLFNWSSTPTLPHPLTILTPQSNEHTNTMFPYYTSSPEPSPDAYDTPSPFSPSTIKPPKTKRTTRKTTTKNPTWTSPSINTSQGQYIKTRIPKPQIISSISRQNAPNPFLPQQKNTLPTPTTTTTEEYYQSPPQTPHDTTATLNKYLEIYQTQELEDAQRLAQEKENLPIQNIQENIVVGESERENLRTTSWIWHIVRWTVLFSGLGAVLACIRFRDMAVWLSSSCMMVWWILCEAVFGNYY